MSGGNKELIYYHNKNNIIDKKKANKPFEGERIFFKQRV